MPAWKTIILAAAIGLLGVAAGSGGAAAPAVDIRDQNGKILIAADQIQSYDWKTHTLTLAPKVRAGLEDHLMAGRGLASGVPFTVALDGKPLYRGTFTSVFASQSFATPVILIMPHVPRDNGKPEQLRIQLGYPTDQFFKGTDPRPDARLRRALRASHKLKDDQLDAAP